MPSQKGVLPRKNKIYYVTALSRLGRGKFNVVFFFYPDHVMRQKDQNKRPRQYGGIYMEERRIYMEARRESTVQTLRVIFDISFVLVSTNSSSTHFKFQLSTVSHPRRPRGG